ncbi:GGDEF domain-containing protein [Dyella sp. 2HG41-7]|uniref:GGDEF domain-containing protein n=1 Tax=Dyella sp. 2HG41-7 TaxID=2883239 RepID=UPI001F371CD2
MRFAWALAVLLIVHLALASWSGHAQDPLPQLAMVAVQCAAVWMVFLRFRRSPPLIKMPWLLLALAALMQVLWAITNLLTTIVGDKGGYLTAIGVVISGLYMIPAMFMLARSFAQHEPRAVIVLDLILSCLVAVLLYQLVTQLLSGPLASDPNSVLVVIYHADAVDFSLAAMAILRMLGARSFRWRYFYYAASTYLLVNAIVAYVYNRIELRGLPWWAGSMVDIPYVMLIMVLMRQPPRLLRAYHPPLGVSQTIASFAPIMMSLMILMLGISVSRISFIPGVMAAGVSVVFYGLRVAIIQSRHLDMQRAVDLSTWRLEQQVGRDPLTGIANRAMLDTRLREALESGRKTGHYCSVLMIDIDFFKQYNDTLGHIAGDACLVRVAGALSSIQVRANDLVARYGGEEFAIVLDNTPADAAQDVAHRLITSIERLEIAHPNCPLGHVTVSIGIATQTQETSMDPTIILDEADRALYRAKSKGRNRLETADAAAPCPSSAQARFDTQGDAIP